METRALQRAISGACALARKALDETDPPGTVNVSASNRDVAVLASAILTKAEIRITADDLQNVVKQPA